MVNHLCRFTVIWGRTIQRKLFTTSHILQSIRRWPSQSLCKRGITFNISNLQERKTEHKVVTAFSREKKLSEEQTNELQTLLKWCHDILEITAIKCEIINQLTVPKMFIIYFIVLTWGCCTIQKQHYIKIINLSLKITKQNLWQYKPLPSNQMARQMLQTHCYIAQANYLPIDYPKRTMNFQQS